MSDFPGAFDSNLKILSTADHSISPYAAVIRNSSNGMGSSLAWNSANQAWFIPMLVKRRVIVTALGILLGADSGAGNVDIGIFTDAGVRIVSTGAVAGGTGWHEDAIADTPLDAGLYFFGASASATTVKGQMLSASAATLAAITGVRRMDAAHPLPSSVTFAAATIQNIPTTFVRIK